MRDRNDGVLEVTGEFSFVATHHLRSYLGSTESPHEHEFKARVVLRVPRLDKDGISIDFAWLSRVLLELKERYNGYDLNALEAFAEINPTAENLAMDIAGAMYERLAPNINATVKYVEVWEMQDMSVRYYPDAKQSEPAS